MTRKPVVTRTEIIAHTRFFQVERIGLRFTNGREVIWERLRSPRAAPCWWCRCSILKRFC